MQNRRPILEKHKQYFFPPLTPGEAQGPARRHGGGGDTVPLSLPGHTAPEPRAGAPQHRSGQVPSPAATPFVPKGCDRPGGTGSGGNKGVATPGGFAVPGEGLVKPGVP